MERHNKYYWMLRDEVYKLKYNQLVELGDYLLQEIPEYFFTVPASSSGKYHPVGDLGEGGLVRHSISVKKMLDHLMELNGYYEFTDRQKELLQLAALFHDCMKSGTQEDYEKNQHTKFLHPILAANFIMYCACVVGLNYDDAKFIYDAVASHMGQWNINKYGDGTLPLPQEPHQKILHLADYLASRQDINIVIEEDEVDVEQKDETINETTNVQTN